MLRVLQFLLFFLFILCFRVEAQTNADITYIDSSGAQKKAPWKTETFIIEKSYKGFKYKKAQTWVALPPLLTLTSNNSNFKTIPNSHHHKSPFADDKNIKTVLQFEHFDSSIVFPMRKKKVGGESTVRIKMDRLLQAPLVSVSESCKQQGIQLDTTKVTKKFLSIDCKTDDSGLKVAIWSSENLTTSTPSSPKIQMQTSRPDHIILALRSEDLKNTPRMDIFSLSSSNRQRPHLLSYERPKAAHAQLPTDDKKKHLTGTLPKTHTWLGNVDRSSVTLVNTSIYGSKLGAEAFLLVNYKPDNSSGFLTFNAIAPIRYFRTPQTDSYLELAASYNHSVRFNSLLPFTFGLGLRGIKLDDFDNKQVTLIGPEVVARLIGIEFFSSFLHYSMSARYTPTFLRPDYQGSRLLWEFANIRIYRSPEFDVSLSSQYSFLEIKTDEFRYTDSKFLGGASIQW